MFKAMIYRPKSYILWYCKYIKLNVIPGILNKCIACIGLHDILFYIPSLKTAVRGLLAYIGPSTV